MAPRYRGEAGRIGRTDDRITRTCEPPAAGRLRTRLETNWGDNSKGPVHTGPLAQPNKGKELILMGESDPPADDELSSGSSPLLACSPPQNNAEAESKKRPLRRSSRSVNGVRRRVLRETSRDRRPSEPAPEYMPIRPRDMAPQFPPVHHPFWVASTPHLVSFPAVRGLEDMLSSLLGPPIQNYPPHPPGLRYAVIFYVRWLH